MQVVIDSSVYREDPKRGSAGFRAIARLATTGRINLHVPHYVYKEFLTQQEEQLSKAVDRIKQGATTLTRVTDHEEIANTAEAVLKEAEALQANLAAHAAEEFNTWITNVHAIIHPLQQDHAQRVTDAYFGGTAPFAARKNRNDIPDAFIYETLKDLVAAHHQLHAIVGDANLRKSCAALPNVQAYETIDEFIATPACQALLTEANAAANIERIKALLPQETDVLNGALETHIIDGLYGRTIRDHDIPDDNNESIVQMVGEPRDTTFKAGDVDYYGDGTLAIPFQNRIECELSYFIFKVDYYGIPDERAENISVSDWSDHYFAASETYDLNVEGRLIIEFPLDELQRDNLEDEDLSALINDSDASVEIEEATVHHEYSY